MTKNRWDILAVNLHDKVLNFSELEKILSMTDNSESYYFKPSVLHIRINGGSMNGHDTVAGKIPGMSRTSDKPDSYIRQIHGADLPGPENPEKTKHRGDVIMSLKGSFFIRKR